MTHKKEINTLNEITIKNGVTADFDLYHFFPSFADLVSSLLDKSIWSNKNERASQFDIQAAYDSDNSLLKDDAYVCFTTYPGKQGMYKGYNRPFGISFADNQFNNNAATTKPFSQVAFKTCKDVNDSVIIKQLQDEYKKKYGEAYGTSFIEEIAQQNFKIQAVGIVPITSDEKDIYKESDDPQHKYFISGGDSAKPWTVRYFSINKTNTTLYNLIKAQFKKLMVIPEYQRQVYWFKDQYYIGPAKDTFKLDKYAKVYKDPEKKHLFDTSKLTFKGLITTTQEISTKTNDKTENKTETTKTFTHNINPQYNLNPNFGPRPDQKLHINKNTGDGSINFNATISFPTSFTEFNEIIGIGRIFWEAGKSNFDFDFVNSSSRNGYPCLKLLGLNIEALLPFLKNMEVNNYDIEEVSLSNKDFESKTTKKLTDKNLILNADQFKALITTFNEHEKRVYVHNKKNLKFKNTDVKSIIIPHQFRVASEQLLLTNLIDYITQLNDSSISNQLNTLLHKFTKKQQATLVLPDKLGIPSELSDTALSALVHYSDGIIKCLKYQLLDLQTEDSTIPTLLKKLTKSPYKLPPYVLKILRSFCKLLESSSSPYGNTSIEFISDGKQKRSVDKLVNAYQKLLDEIKVAQEDEITDKAVNTNTRFYGVPKSFFEPETNKNGVPNYARYLINASKYFDIDKAYTDEDNKVYGNEISVLAPIKPDITGEKGENAQTGQAARVGTEILLIGFDKQENGYLLMVPKPHLSTNFFELPGGGIAKVASIKSETSRIEELKDKLVHKTGITKDDIKYIVKSYPYQLLFSETSTSDNTDVLSKISWSFYFLSGGIYTKFIDPNDLEFRHQNKDYNAYLTWFPLNSIEYKQVFLARYSKTLPYIKELYNQGKQLIKNGTITDENEIESESSESKNTSALNEKLLREFFDTFWKQ